MEKDTPLMGFMEVSNEGECSVCLSGDKEMMQLSCEHIICVTCFLRRVASGSPHSGACLQRDKLHGVWT